MSELHLPSKTMKQLDRSFWESIESERAHFLSGPAAPAGSSTQSGPTPAPSQDEPNSG